MQNGLKKIKMILFLDKDDLFQLCTIYPFCFGGEIDVQIIHKNWTKNRCKLMVMNLN